MESHIVCHQFDSLFVRARKHERCLDAFIGIQKDYEKLPVHLMEKFDFPFGLDKDLCEFLKSQFDVDLSILDNDCRKRVISELLDGVVSDTNPIVGLIDSDIIADRICEYSELSVQIRDAFGLSLNFRHAPYEIFTDLSQHNVDTMTSPVYDDNGIPVENLTMQVDWYKSVIDTSNMARKSGCNSPEEVVKFTARSSTYSAEVKNIFITIFDDGVSIGSIKAKTVSCNPLAAKGRNKATGNNQKIRNSYLINDTETYSESLYDSMIHLSQLSTKYVDEKNKDMHMGMYTKTESLANQFYLPDTGGRYASMHIEDVNFHANLKSNFINIIESLRMIFEDITMYHKGVFSRCGLTDQIQREVFADTELVKVKSAQIKEDLYIDGISAIVCEKNKSWWQVQLQDFKPCDQHFDCPTSVLVYDSFEAEEINLSILSEDDNLLMKNNLSEMPIAIEALFAVASQKVLQK